VLRSIASGGMAQVYEVQDPASEERFALKLLVASVALRRFNREYEAMTRLNHPGIVRVYHYGLHEGLPWLTMELLRGTPAQSYLKDFGKTGSPERMREALRISYFLSTALAYVHDRGLVHRDLKSANVLVLPDERVKLIDFGTAHLADPLERITLDGEFVGTFAYASPEQISGRPVDWRSDLYSLGVLMYRLVTGKRPFPGNDADELAHQHNHVAPSDPRSLAPNVPDVLANLMLQLLAKKPEERPLNAHLVARAIEDLAGAPFSTRARLAIHSHDAISRDAERRAVRARLSANQPGELVVLAGHEGSDRSRVADRVLAEAVESGWTAFRCGFGGETELADLVAMLGKIAHGHDGATAAMDLVRNATTDDALAQATLRTQLLHAAASVVVARGDRGPILLGLMEVHLAGPVAVAILGAIRRRVLESRAKVAFVASSVQSALGQETEIGRWMRDAQVFLLEALPPRAVAVAVATMLGRRPPPVELTRRLHNVTDGQPLYLEQAVEEIVRAGVLEAEGNRLEWADSTVDVGLPPLARRTAGELLATLPFPHRDVLTAMALLGDATQVSSVAAGLGWEADEVELVVADLVTRGLIDAQLAWCVPALKTLVLDAMPRRRRLAIARALIPELSKIDPTRALVTCLLDVGRVDEAVFRASELGRTLGASRRLRQLIELLEPVVARASRARPCEALAEIHLLYGQAVQGVRPTDPAAARSLAAARKLAGKNVQLRARAELTTARWQAVIGHYRNYAKHLREAWETLERGGDAMSKATVAVEIGRASLLQGNFTQAESWYERAQAVSSHEQGGGLAAAALVGHATVQYGQGFVDRAEETACVAMQACDRGEDPPGLWSAAAMWAHALRRQGRYSEALAMLYRRLPEASQWPDPGPYVSLVLAAACCEIDLARVGRAQEYVDELAATLHRGEYLHLRIEAGVVAGQILLVSGQFREAAWSLQETWNKARLAELTVLSERSRALLGHTLYALGDHEAGRSTMQSACLALQASGDLLSLADACTLRAQSLEGDEDPRETFRLVEDLVTSRPLPLLKLEHLLATVAWHRKRDEREPGMAAVREAALVLNRLATGLNDTDRAALRVHPWSRRIRSALATR
jgi:tetratricopeptide (TPR) repeat protein